MELWTLVIVAVVATALYFAWQWLSSAKNEVVINVTTRFEEGFTTNFEEYEDDSDAWEGGFWDASDPRPFKAHLRFDYTDGGGIKTTRSVVVREFDNSLYSGIILGRCELRNANRTFRFDRMRNCIDLETGEVVENIRSYLNAKYKESPDHSVELLVTDYLDVLKVLFYVAKADGQYKQDEKEVISSFVQKLIRDERVSARMLDPVLNEIGVPSLQAFKLALGRVLKSGQVDPKLLAECCNAIVATQKTVSPAEEEALEYIEKKRFAIESIRN